MMKAKAEHKHYITVHVVPKPIYTMNRLHGLGVFLAGCILSWSSSAFHPTAVPSMRRNVFSRQHTYCSAYSSKQAVSQESLNSEIFLLSFDGTVAKTTEWRISQGIDMCFQTWPHLTELEVVANDKTHEWLRNKMRALSHVLTARPNASLACEFSFLARLLVEEQMLDQGRSNGKSGKYASKFHPQSTTTTSSSSSSTSSSRPLTVGEIAANWNKGGCLAETVQAKYHVNYKDPLPILQEMADQLAVETTCDIPEVNEVVMDALSDFSGNVIVTVSHESDIPMAEKVLACLKKRTSHDLKLMASLDDECEIFGAADETCGNVVTLVPVKKSTVDVVETLLQLAPDGSTVNVFESSWQALEQEISLFGDCVPRVGSRSGTTTVGRDVRLSLNFPNWASNSPETQHNAALMNPWTNLVNEEHFSELFTARIVRR